MTDSNPLADSAPTDVEDRALVARAASGDREALHELVQRHQAWIYNIAVRMLAHPQDAEDATQEILIKALTRLSSFEGRSRFRTWLYRIAVNHVLNMKRGRREQPAMTFGCYAHGLDTTPDLELPDQRSVPADVRLLVDEARLTCTSGMLLCLDREQRVIYILGEIFEVTDAVGRRTAGDQPRELPPTAGSRPTRAAQLHERQVWIGEPRESLPVRQEDPWLHAGGLGGSREPAVRA